MASTVRTRLLACGLEVTCDAVAGLGLRVPRPLPPISLPLLRPLRYRLAADGGSTLRVEEEGDLVVGGLDPAAAAALVERRAMDRALELMVRGGWTLLAAALEDGGDGAARLVVAAAEARVLVRGRQAFAAPRFVAADAGRGSDGPTPLRDLGGVILVDDEPAGDAVATPALVPRLLAAMIPLDGSRRDRLAQALALAALPAATRARAIVAP